MILNMIKIGLILSSFLLFSCQKKQEIYEVELSSNFKDILVEFSKENAEYLEEMKDKVFFEIFVSNDSEESDLKRIQIYLVEFRLNDSIQPIKGHSMFNNLNVVIEGELDFNVIGKNKVISSYKHKYGSSENYLYDPPYWNLYFDKKGKLVKAMPKRVFETLRKNPELFGKITN